MGRADHLMKASYHAAEVFVVTVNGGISELTQGLRRPIERTRDPRCLPRSGRFDFGGIRELDRSL